MNQESPKLNLEELENIWSALSNKEKIEGLELLAQEDARRLWTGLDSGQQAALFPLFAPEDQGQWIGLLDPDDITDLIQESGSQLQDQVLNLLDAQMRSEVSELLSHEEDLAGGLMTSRFLALPQGFAVHQAIDAVRRCFQDKKSGGFYYLYVLEESKKLVGVLSLRELFLSRPDARLKDVMQTSPVAVLQHLDQEEVARVFGRNNFSALPVVDENGLLKGIVTLDDIVDVVEEEATEDFQKLGGSEALDKPYLRNTIFDMFRKRAGWLAMLFVGSTLTTSAMHHFESKIQKLLVLTIFIPLVISSGGNAGSQASTLIVRAIALQEVAIRDWWRVLLRESSFGLFLGVFIGSLGFLMILIWPNPTNTFGAQFLRVGFTIGLSLLCNIMWGTIVGSMLPFALKKLNFDPASASTPFVATIVDVTGITIYFTVASFILTGLE